MSDVWTEEDHDRALLAEENFEFSLAMELAQTKLAKLNVAELRVLMAHYCGGKPRDYADMRKADMVCEIAPEYAAQCEQ